MLRIWERPGSIHLLKLTGPSSCCSQHQRVRFHNLWRAGSKERVCIFKPIQGCLIQIFFFFQRQHCWISSSQPDSLWRPSCLEGDTGSRKSSKTFLSLCKCIVFLLLATSERKSWWRSTSSCWVERRWATCRAGPALHWASFSETKPTGWSINVIDCVAWQCRLLIDKCLYRCGWVVSYEICLSNSIYSWAVEVTCFLLNNDF